MNLEQSMSYIDLLIQKGWSIEYEIVDQVENGNMNEDGTPKDGAPEMPRYTVTSYPYPPNSTGGDPVERYIASFDNLAEMYVWLATQMKRERLDKL